MSRSALVVVGLLAGCDLVLLDRRPEPAPTDELCGVERQQRLCLAFSDDLEDGFSDDGSGHGNHVAVAGVTATLRGTRSAVEVGATSQIAVIHDTPTLDLVETMTIDLWVAFDTVPPPSSSSRSSTTTPSTP